jgi:hypothetical protein
MVSTCLLSTFSLEEGGELIFCKRMLIGVLQNKTNIDSNFCEEQGRRYFTKDHQPSCLNEFLFRINLRLRKVGIVQIQ